MLGPGRILRENPERAAPADHYFLGTTGHHDGTAESGAWLVQHKDVFAKTALIINCEHTAATEMILNNGALQKSNWASTLTLVRRRQPQAGRYGSERLPLLRRGDERDSGAHSCRAKSAASISSRPRFSSSTPACIGTPITKPRRSSRPPASNPSRAPTRKSSTALTASILKISPAPGKMRAAKNGLGCTVVSYSRLG